jgi:hypothetical protein
MLQAPNHFLFVFFGIETAFQTRARFFVFWVWLLQWKGAKE